MTYAARWSLPIPAILLTGLFLAHCLAVGMAPARAESVIGLTTANSLVTFDSATPGAISAAIPITGIGAETIFDIDRRQNSHFSLIRPRINPVCHSRREMRFHSES